MLPMAVYAEQITAGDTGRWRSAVQLAAQWIGVQHPTIDLDRQLPLPQLTVQAIALLVYGLAASRDADPRTVAGAEVLAWLSEHQLPTPPDPDDGDIDGGAAEFRDRLTVWRYGLDEAADRQRRDLAELLRAAGHQVPQPAPRALDRYSPDPVIMVWLGLVDTAPPDLDPPSMMDQLSAAPLSFALTAATDLL